LESTLLRRSITRKFMHQPSQTIRQAGENNDHKTLEILSGAFGIDKDK